MAVVAEGVVLDLDERDLQGLGKVERDDHGHMRIAEINVGEGLRSAVRERLAELGHDITFVSKDIGYELRLHRSPFRLMRNTPVTSAMPLRSTSLTVAAGHWSPCRRSTLFLPLPSWTCWTQTPAA